MIHAVEALAESWASIDGKLEQFKNGKAMTDEDGGYYEGYIADSHEMIDRLRKRGFDILRVMEHD